MAVGVCWVNAQAFGFPPFLWSTPDIWVSEKGLCRSGAVGEEGPYMSLGSSLCFSLMSGPKTGTHGGVADPIKSFGIRYQCLLLWMFMLLAICSWLQNSYSYVFCFRFCFFKSQSQLLLFYQSSQDIWAPSPSQAEAPEFPVCSSQAQRTSSAISHHLPRLILSYVESIQLLTLVRLFRTQIHNFWRLEHP